MRRRGYTLIELAVASVMASILTTAGLSAFVMFNSQRVRIERAATADDTAKVVTQYLVRELQRIGGATLRPWQAIAVEQEPSCTDPRGLPCVRGDRMTFAFIDDRAVFQACRIEALTNTAITFERTKHNGRVSCCNLFRVGQTSPVAPSALTNTHLMLSSTGTAGTSEEQFRAVTYTGTAGNAETCVFPIRTSRQVRPLSSTCVAGQPGCDSQGRPANSVFANVGSFTQTRATAMPITVATAYIGCTTTSCAGKVEDLGLFIFSDRDAGASDDLVFDAAIDDNFAVSPNVIDLQVALGYDRNDDGEIEESIDGSDDDYSGNASPNLRTDPFADFAIPPGETAEDPRRLRMIHVGIMAAIKVNDPKYVSEAQLPGAPPEIGVALHLRALTSKAAFRSLNLLE